MEHPYLRVKKGFFSKNEKKFGKNLVESNICSTFALAIQKWMLYRGVEQLVARQAHNLEVACSSPAAATKWW